MSNKSHASMEQKQCFVCLETYDTGAILLDKRLRQSMDKYTITGTGLCPEHQKMRDDGFVLLVGIDENASRPHIIDTGAPGDAGEIEGGKAVRTGSIMTIRRTAWDDMFNAPPPENGVGFVDEKVIRMAEEMMQRAKGEVTSDLIAGADKEE